MSNIPSNSERYLLSRKGAPVVQNEVAYKVTNERKSVIQGQIIKGEVREGYSHNIPKEQASVYSPAVAIVQNKSLQKTAADGFAPSSFNGGNGNGSSWNGNGNTLRQGPDIYSPFWLNSNTSLPRDRGTMNAWNRAFFALHPIVNNALSLHSTYPVSKLNITCSDKKVETFCAEMAEEMDLLNVCVQMAQEFFVIGEVFPLLEIDPENLKWKRCVIQNPDFMHVERTAIAGEPRISIKPDEALKRIVTQNDPESARLRKEIPPEIVQFIKNGKNIPLDNFFVSHLARRISPYDTRGTSLICSCYKALMLWDKMRECKYAQADNLINPITLVKLGGSADADYKPNMADIEAWRDLLANAQYDHDFKIITHGSVTIERVGAQSVIDISNDLTQLLKEIYIGLMVPQVIMESGDITYANGSLSLDVLRQRYLQFQNMLSKWIRTKVFAPICELNNFWDRSDKEKKLIIPNVEWNHMSLFDLTDYIQQLSQLATDKKIVSVHTLYRSLGLDYEHEQTLIKKEAIIEAIHKKEQEVLDNLSLAELRALQDNGEIPDLPDTPVPGESPDEEKPEDGGEAAGGGMPMPPPGAPS